MKNGKRILSVTIRRMIDESPDTSWLGQYSNRPETEFAIDRAHSEVCASLNPRNDEGLEWLDRIQSAISDNLPDVRELQPHGNYYLQEEIDAIDSLDECRAAMECDCSGGGMGRGELRYFNGPVENYKGESPEDIRKCIRQDYDRMESLNRGDWCFIGLRAEAEVQTGSDVVQRITSGGLWGIESDSGREHLEDTQREELAQLKTELVGLGFSRRAIATAFKNVLEKGA
jgi:hypothetical protein